MEWEGSRMMDIKPCPFCGESYLEVKASKIAHGTDYIRCEVCGAKIEYVHGKGEDLSLGQILGALIEKWNRRDS